MMGMVALMIMFVMMMTTVVGTYLELIYINIPQKLITMIVVIMMMMMMMTTTMMMMMVMVMVGT